MKSEECLRVTGDVSGRQMASLIMRLGSRIRLNEDEADLSFEVSFDADSAYISGQGVLCLRALLQQAFNSAEVWQVSKPGDVVAYGQVNVRQH